MKAYTKNIFSFILLALSSHVIYAQRPVAMNAESGNRNTDAALCWVFPGTIHSATSKINGNFSSRTGQLTGGLAFPNGVESPWIKFDGTGTIKWKMKLEKWAGVDYRRFAIIRVGTDGSQTTIAGYNFTEANSQNVFNGNNAINFSGVFKLLFYFYGEGGTTRGIIDDIIIDGEYWAAPSHNCDPKTETPKDDDDGDGIPNDKDAFPKDPIRAFECYHPATSGPGTLMFEDLWPKKGDYDLNDLVAEYKIRFTYNAQNNLVDAEMKIVTKALGAGNSNGLMYQFDNIKSAQIESVTGFKRTNNIVTIGNNGVESGQSKANILIFDNGNTNMPNGTPGKNVTNADLSQPFITPDTTTVNIKFKTDATNAIHYTNLSFNPYLIANQKRGVEIHLPGYAPTDKADASLFGTFDDDTILSTRKYYQTRDNLPWGIDVHTAIPYMQEQKEISTGYSKFIQWALSNGAQFNDWYLDKPGYRNNSNLYIR